MNTIPTILENVGNERFVYDLYSRLLKDRIIFLSGPIDESVAKLVIAEMLYLDQEDPNSDIKLYINSPGGEISAGLAIYDTMKHIKAEITTIGIGIAASFGSVLLSSGKKGKRFALPNTEILIHQPWVSGGIEGQVTDLEIRVSQLAKNKKKLAKILSDNTGQKVERILEDSERDKWFSAEEAMKYGLIDKVLK
jgi:ATP-dependent Clp protease, protease subunit